MSGKMQNGSALIIALVILMVMTLIGLTSMNTSIMEEKMAGSMFNRNLALQAAESALRQGEAWLVGTTSGGYPGLETVGTQGIWKINAADSDGDDDPWWNEVDASWWATNAEAIADASTDGEWIDGVVAQPSYVIEEIQRASVSLEVGKSSEDMDIYLQVTARGVGGTSSSVVMLQSNYKW